MSSDRLNKKEKNKVTGVMRNSLYVVFFMILLFCAGLIGRLVYLNNVNGDSYAKAVLSQQLYQTTGIKSERGSILDRNGVVLARNEKYYNVIIDPAVILEQSYYYNPSVEAIVTAFGYDRDEIEQLIKDNPTNRYIVYERDADYAKITEYYKYRESHKHVVGVWFEENYRRVYPFSTLASHVIGFTNSDGVGSYGIEGYYNDALTGTDGVSSGYYDSELNRKKIIKDAVDGDNVVSTIDYNIQTVVERLVAEFIDDNGCENIGVIVMNPNNAEILAMASNTEFDLNNPRSLADIYDEEELALMSNEEKVNALYSIWRNYCISDGYEPGSTYKTITVSAALEEDVILTNDTFLCEGAMEIGGWRISCNNKYGHGDLTVAQSLMKSCNCALMTIAEKMGPSDFFRYQRLFGFGAKTGVDLIGETPAKVIDRKNLNQTELATSSFGTTFTVNMVQVAAAYASILNGGNYYKPHVVKEIRKNDGTGAVNVENEVLRQTVSSSTSAFIRNALYMTVESGTATPAKVSGYLIGGKTGTAQKRPREEKKYVVSFVGFAPIENPQVMAYVVIDEVHNPELVGKSTPATQMTAAIFKEILPYLGMYPDGDIEYVVNEELISDLNNDAYNPAEDEMNPDVIPIGLDDDI